MPYIRTRTRACIDPYVNAVRPFIGGKPGNLAYALTKLTLDFVEDAAMQDRRVTNFADYAAALGVLEAIKLELYRQQVAAYEDDKLAENGPVSS